MERIYKKTLDSIISEGTSVISNKQRDISGNTGWHQHLGSDKIGIVATAMALLFYKDIVKLPCPKSEECIEFLKKTQQADGGWSFITNSKGVSNVLATCWAIRALHKYNADRHIIRKGIEWLFSKKQKGDYGWSLFGTKSQTFPTCFCIITLLELGEKIDCEAISSALSWLRNTVIQDGSWANSPEKPYQSLFHTAITILCLQNAKISTDNKLINNGLDWIEKKFQNKDFSEPCYECDLELIEEQVNNENIRVPYFHFTLPYVASVFLNANRGDHVVFKCIRLLVDRNEGGSWPHPFIENKKIIPIWTLYDGVQAIKVFNESMQRKIDSSRCLISDFYDFIGNSIAYYKISKNKITWVRTYSPIRLTDKIGKIIIRFIIVILITATMIYLVLQNCGGFVQKTIKETEFISIFTSVIASIIYAFLFGLANRIIKWIYREKY